LKVLLLNSLGIYGGGEFFVLQLAGFLRFKGNDVWVGCRKDTPLYTKCSEAGINTVIFDFPENSKGKLKKNVNAVKEFVSDNGIQIVHTNTNYDRTAGAVAAELAGAVHVASVHSLQSISHNITHWTRNKFFVDKFLADGKIVKSFLIRKDKIDEKKISVVNLGIEPDLYKHDNAKRAALRSEFEISEDEILVGNVGRLVDFKGQEVLVKAFKITADEFPQARLMIVGEGELMEFLKKLAAESGLKDKIIFAGSRDDMQAVYSAFDIYAHTPKEGGGELFPFAVLYAMAAGLPAVATGVGEIPNMILEDENGFIVNYSEKEISKKLHRLICDKTLRQTMGTNGINRLKDEFTLDKMGGDILKLYNDVMSKINI
jgi:glycosyltransferase involved in cell wall biosynthesis